jgi:hypothetical protein
MTQNEIIAMARQAGGMFSELPLMDAWIFDDKTLEAFAKLVAQYEREACAEIAEKQRYAMHISLTSSPIQNGTAVGIANAIRARGQA